MPLRLVHMTDIFHPHGDPDDHYDLAVAFALHARGYLELHRVIMDYPPAHRLGDPALCAVAQLNEITHSDVRACVAPSDPRRTGEMILSILRESDLPVAFSVVGTTANIAAAISADSRLFQEKCAGIYLAAGTGMETPGGDLEYNVRLHPAAYAATLSAPCPIYWAPCYHTIRPDLGEQGGEYCSVYCLHQKELLAHLPPVMQKYFLYMLTRSEDPQYLRYLHKPLDAAALMEHGENKRRLWSTPLLLHAGGVPCDSFEFIPVRVNAQSDGHLTWVRDESSAIHLLHLTRCDRETADSFDTTGTYRAEMVAKLRELLSRFD